MLNVRQKGYVYIVKSLLCLTDQSVLCVASCLINGTEVDMRLKIPFKTPSINKLYKTNRFGTFYVTPEGKELKKQINDLLSKELLDKPPESELEVMIVIHENWYTKKNEVKRKDVDNRAKFLLDAIFDHFGVDDKFIFSLLLKKVQDEEEFSEVFICPLSQSKI